jgi:hypothetical protein
MPNLHSSTRPWRLPRLHRERWSRANLLAVLAALVLAVTSIATVLAQGLGPAGPSPASGHASVVAHGVISLAEGNGRWHITRHIAEVGAAPIEITVSGFVIAEGTPILVTNVDTSVRQRLASGEALMVHAGEQVTVETFGAPDNFIFVQLTSADGAPLAGSIDDIFTSAAFPVPGDERDADLLRDVIAEGDTTVIPAGVVPTTVYVMRGEVAISNAGDETTLATGEGGTFAGDLEISAIADGSVIYAAYVGSSIPVTTPPATPATPESTPLPATPEPTPVLATPTPVPPTPSPEPTVAPTVPPTPDTTDDDADFLTNVQEARVGTDPANPDTDDDGLGDGDELINIGTNPLVMDTDDDLLYDGGEIVYDTDPLNPDTDGDGIGDGAEVYIYETDPADADTDGDGTPDGVEINNGTNPRASGQGGSPQGSSPDSDGDGLTNAQEARVGTNSGVGDTDGDSVNDSNEVAAGTNPLNPRSYP